MKKTELIDFLVDYITQKELKQKESYQTRIHNLKYPYLSFYLILGKSASGKTYFSENINSIYNKVITSTTRKPRENEIDKKDYYFIDEKEWNKYEFAESSEFLDKKYGLQLDELKNKIDLFYKNNKEYKFNHNNIGIIVEPNGYEFWQEVLNQVNKKIPINIYTMYFDIDKNQQLDRLNNRNATKELIEKTLQKNQIFDEWKQKQINDGVWDKKILKTFFELYNLINSWKKQLETNSKLKEKQKISLQNKIDLLSGFLNNTITQNQEVFDEFIKQQTIINQNKNHNDVKNIKITNYNFLKGL